jgi:hypothetical protein
MAVCAVIPKSRISLRGSPVANASLRSLLREYYPAALAAVAVWKKGLCRPEAREILRLAQHEQQN